MTAKRLVLVLLLSLLTVIMVGLGYLHYANLNQYRDQIAARLSTLTGRDVTIGDVDIDLWPAISITANNVNMANVSWGSQPDMIEIGHLSISVRPLSLLYGPVLVKDLMLKDVSLLLETDEQGKSNWDLANVHGERKDTEKPDTASARDGLPVMLENAMISNVVLIQHRSGTPDRQFRLDKLTVMPDNTDRLDIVGTGKILEMPLVLRGQIGTRQQLGETGDGEFTLSGSLADLQLEMTGRFAITDRQGATHIKLLVSSDDVKTFIEAAGLSVPLSGTLTIKTDITSNVESRAIKIDGSLDEFNTKLTMNMEHGDVNLDGKLENTDKLGTMLGVANMPKDEIAIKGSMSLSDQSVKLHEISVSTGKSRIAASGRVATGEERSTLHISATGNSLMDLMTNLPPLAFDGSADVSLSPNGVKVDPLKLHFGASDIDGSLEITDTANKTIKTDLVSTTLDLTELLSYENAEDSNQQATTLNASDKTTESDAKHVFSDDALPFDQLQHTEMDINLLVNKLVTPTMTFNKVEAEGTLHQGIMKANIGFRTMSGGRSENTIVLDASGKQANLQASVDVRNIQLKILSGKVKDNQDIPATDLSAQLKSTGNTPHALAANSNGRVIVIMRGGLIDNTIITNVSGDILAQLLTALNPFAKQEPYSNLDCGIAVLNIQDGMSTFENFLVQDKKIMIVAGGDINLKTEKIDVEFNTKPREGVGISADMFVTPFVALGGTLADPGIRVKKTGTLFTLGAALATGGLSIALQGGMDRVTGEVDQCSLILPKYPLPSLAD